MQDDFENDLSILRALMARELDTINHYQRLADDADDESAREFFLHIQEEEKLHVAEALALIARMDADQTELLRTGFRAGHRPGEIPERPPQEAVERALPAAAQPPKPGDARRREPALTVGSLRGVPQ
jgi:rubrerythrin